MLQTTNGDTLTSLILSAASVRDVPGAAAECGVLQGGTLRALSMVFPNKTVLGFDTFNGMPAQSWSDGDVHGIGDFAETSLETVADNILGRGNIVLVPGVFPDACRPYRHWTFAFVYVDFDLYHSTLAAIDWFLPRMSSGGLMVFDDYDWPMCPGVKRAIEERSLQVELPCSYQAICRIS
jgi:O-methyltransferase